MAFKQPRVPEYRESEGASKHLRALTLFLKDFCQDVWTATRLNDKGLAGIEYPVTSVNKKTGDVVIGASDIATLQHGSWNGNSTPGEIPVGLSTVYGNLASDSGFPASYVTVFAAKESVHRTFQLLIEKTSGKMHIRSATDATNWGSWRRYLYNGEIYPVGAIYLSVSSTSPASLFGGTWEQLKDRFLLGAGSTYTAGGTGGAANVTLTTAQMPAHTHTRGTMEITGAFYSRPHKDGGVYGGAIISDAGEGDSYTEGAFTWTRQVGADDSYGMAQSSTKSNNDRVSLKASNGWTGATSSTGSGSAHNNMPPYLTVYMWKRVS